MTGSNIAPAYPIDISDEAADAQFQPAVGELVEHADFGRSENSAAPAPCLAGSLMLRQVIAVPAGESMGSKFIPVGGINQGLTF